MRMEIRIGSGLGDTFVFGMPRRAIEEVLGAPDRVWVDPLWAEDEGDEREELQYDGRRTSFRIYEGDRLGWIRTRGRDATLLGERIVDRAVEDAVRDMAEAGYGPPEIEDYGTWRSVSWEHVSLELQTSYGRVDEVNLGVLFRNEEEYDWPE